MKYFILFLLLIVSENAFSLTVYYNQKTGQVFNVTNDKMILSASDQPVITSAALPANFDINTLTQPFSYYNYVNGAFVLNTAMLVADNNTKVAHAQTAQNTDAARASAIAKLTDA